jgi:hypothetical protein
MSSTFLSKSFLGPCTAKDVKIKAIASTTKQKVDNRAGRRRVGPTNKFVASPEVILRATIGTLQTGYPYIQVSSQDKLQACIHTLPHALQLWISPPSLGGLRCCHVSYGSEPHLLAEVGSGAAMCPMAPYLASRLSWASTLPRVLYLRTSPPG